MVIFIIIGATHKRASELEFADRPCTYYNIVLCTPRCIVPAAQKARFSYSQTRLILLQQSLRKNNEKYFNIILRAQRALYRYLYCFRELPKLLLMPRGDPPSIDRL